MDKFKQMTFSGLREDDSARRGSLIVSLTVDKIFIYAIIALIIVVLIFSLGVEQGKKVAAQKFEHALLQMAGPVNPSVPPLAPDISQASPVVTVNTAAPLEKTAVPVSPQSTETVFAAAVEKPAPVQKVPAVTPVPVQKETKSEPKAIPAKAVSVKPAAVKEPAAQTAVPAAKKGLFYFIQVMSYSNEPDAQKLAKTLKSEGFSAYVNPRGKFHAVVVGNFSQKNEAERTLASLKKKYKDSFIRRKES